MADSTCGDRPSRREFWLPAIISAVTMFVAVLDTMMMNVAVPVIVRDLDTSVSAMQPAFSVYSVVIAALIIPAGTLRAAIETRRLLFLALGTYSVGTPLAGFSRSMPALFFGWSIIEGMTAALLLPITYSIIVDNYEGSERATAFGAVGGVTAAGIAVGPIVGVTLTDSSRDARRKGYRLLRHRRNKKQPPDEWSRDLWTVVA